MHKTVSGVQTDTWAVASGLQSAACMACTADGAYMAVGGTAPTGAAAVHFIDRAGAVPRCKPAILSAVFQLLSIIRTTTMMEISNFLSQSTDSACSIPTRVC